ncbi:MAG TPA: glycoside hydrolase family 3 N-terminal domain-containing protein, partial [Candidatus Limnocylindria bacterium]|nr:glycoside hydrolase family 3 N-terminal domain-containing protein [Candidatus Limnocylindria bacterium]
MLPTSRLSRRSLLAAAMGGVGALLAACLSQATRTGSQLPTGTPLATPSPATSPTPSVATPPGPSLEARIAQMLLVGFRGTDASSAAPIVEDIRRRSLGGVVLFSSDQPTGSPVRNVISPEQVAALTGALQDAAADSELRAPLLVAVDQEGGLVARLDPAHGFPATPSAAELGARNDPAYTRRRSA